MPRGRFLTTLSVGGGLLLAFGSLFIAQMMASVQAAPLGQGVVEGEAIFRRVCAACHTIGRGKLVGPDLQDVTARRELVWLRRWIKEPDKVLAEGDPIAAKLLREFNNVPMPNLRLTDEQVDALIAYLQSLHRTAAKPTPAFPALYFPTLIAALVAAGGLTAVGLLAAKKRVEVRP
jgi:mono/diheme cytochrome c family protein